MFKFTSGLSLTLAATLWKHGSIMTNRGFIRNGMRLSIETC